MAFAIIMASVSLSAGCFASSRQNPDTEVEEIRAGESTVISAPNAARPEPVQSRLEERNI